MTRLQFAALTLLFFNFAPAFAGTCTDGQAPLQYSCKLTATATGAIVNAWSSQTDQRSCITKDWDGAFSLVSYAVNSPTDGHSIIQAVSEGHVSDVDVQSLPNVKEGDVMSAFTISEEGRAMGTFDIYKIHAALGRTEWKGIRVSFLKVKWNSVQRSSDKQGQIVVNDDKTQLTLTCSYNIL